ncbi:MAG: hypothetical protein MJB14_05735, partial [Spirochaetes bacterium]|nr:hypothetical protein [Spirochaetota bacterium]
MDYFALMGLAVYAVYSQKHCRLFSILANFFNFWAFIYSILVIWELPGRMNVNEDWWWQFFAVSLTISFGFAHSSLILLIKPKNEGITFFKSGVVILIGITDFYFILMLLDLKNTDYVLLAILTILLLLGSIVTPIANKLSR